MYHLFSGRAYYPRPTMTDYQGSFDRIEEAKKAALKSYLDDWFQIVVQVDGDYINPAKLVLLWSGEADYDDSNIPPPYPKRPKNTDHKFSINWKKNV